MTEDDWGWDPDTFANGFAPSPPILDQSIDASDCEPSRGSPVTMWTLLTIFVVAGMASIAVAGPAYLSQYLSGNVTDTLQSASSVQDDTFARSGLYLSDTAELKARGTSISWPSRLTVVASCSDGYVLAAFVPGQDRTYLSSAQESLGTSLKEMRLPDCVTPQMLGRPATVPDKVDRLTVARATSGVNQIGEGIHAEWQPVTGCAADEHPIYTVVVANVLSWSQKPLVATTTKTKIDVQQVWNGSKYGVTVNAQCYVTGAPSESAKADFAQTLPAPTSMNVRWITQRKSFVSMNYTRVSSSPLVTYYSEYNKGGIWYPLVSGLSESTFEFFPSEYRYGYGDTFRVSAMSDDGFETDFSGVTSITR